MGAEAANHMLSTVKPRKCEVCQTDFTPASRMGAKVCGAKCAVKWVKQAKINKKTAEKAKLTRRKDALKTIPVLIREAQTEFNKWVRARDRHEPCISCGKPHDHSAGYQRGRDSGHFRSIGQASHLRFHEDNVHAQCVHCNQFLAGNVLAYRARLIVKIGLKRVEALEASNAVHKWTGGELRGIKACYKAKLIDLKEQE